MNLSRLMVLGLFGMLALPQIEAHRETLLDSTRTIGQLTASACQDPTTICSSIRGSVSSLTSAASRSAQRIFEARARSDAHGIASTILDLSPVEPDRKLHGTLTQNDLVPAWRGRSASKY